MSGKYRKAANLTERFEPPRANCVTVRRPRKHVNADRVRGIPFVRLRNALFIDEYRPPEPHQVGAILLPGHGLDMDRPRRCRARSHSDSPREVGGVPGISCRRKGLQPLPFRGRQCERIDELDQSLARDFAATS